MSMGSTLRAAREACGMTTSELAARTHMLVQIVEGIENEDFRRIPAPIYGRGFIKLYCEAVKIDPKPLQAEFMELFNRSMNAPAKVKPPPVRQLPPAKPAEPESPATVQETVPEPLPDARVPPSPLSNEEAAQPHVEPESKPMPEFGELFAQPEPPKQQVAQPVRDSVMPPPKRSYGDLFGQTYAAEAAPPRASAAEKFRNTMSNVSSGVFANVQNLPPNTGRIVTVSVCAIIVFSLIGWGVFELYKATTPTGGETPARTEAVVEADAEKPKATPKVKKDEPQKETKSAKKPLPSKPGELKASGIEIPSLYID